MENITVLENMAARGRKHGSQATEVRKIVGSYKLQGSEENPRLTISTELDDEDFPNQLGSELKVELVIPADESADPYLEVYPKGD